MGTTTRTTTDTRLGRRVPSDDRHIRKFPFSAVAPAAPVEKVERTLRIPELRSRIKTHDQGREGACVGYGTSMMMRILNGVNKVYDCRWLWNQAKLLDEWPDTNPGDDNGTSVRAACDVLRTMGHVICKRGVDQACSLEEGIKENRWAQTVDELRLSISMGIPVAIGVSWYEAFYSPIKLQDGQRFWWWLPKGSDNLGRLSGGHCVCIYGASDRLQAFRFVNSWGASYPLALIPYSLMDRLLREDGEATLVVDRIPDATIQP